MSRLIQNSLPAERLRGCLFAEKFESADKVINNGGSISGSPAINFGLAIDGVSDSISYPVDVSPVRSYSFWITLATGTEDILRLTAVHSIEAVAGSITTTPAPGAGTNIYVNGVLGSAITTDRSFVVVTMTSGLTLTDLIVGQDDSFGEFTIEDLKLWEFVLEPDEIYQMANNSTYIYKDSAALDLSTLTENHDAANTRSLDISSNDNHATFGDGATSTTYPTKTKSKGYYFDGGDYLDTGTGFQYISDVSVALWFNVIDYSSTSMLFNYYADATNGWGLQISTAGEVSIFNDISNAGVNLYANTIYPNTWNHIVAILDSLDNKMYLNGSLINSGTTALDDWSSFAGTFYIGAMEPSSQYFNGYISNVQVFDSVLSNIQVKDLYINGSRNLNII